MDAILHTIGAALRTFALWELNALLAWLYVAWTNAAALVAAGAWVTLLWGTPSGQRRPHPLADQLAGQRPWLLGIGLLVVLAAFLNPAPLDVLLAVMASVGALVVWLERFNPDALRWRVAGGQALYALASLAYLGYASYLGALDAQAWAEALGGQGAAAATLAQGQAFINTLATWGLWLILPLAYFSLLAQGVLAHPPLGNTPENIITAVRTRGQGR